MLKDFNQDGQLECEHLQKVIGLDTLDINRIHVNLSKWACLDGQLIYTTDNVDRNYSSVFA